MTRRCLASGTTFRLGPSVRRAGRGLVEVIVVIAILAFAVVLILMAMPRGRETARMAGCQKNLMQIGVGLQMYHQASHRYPAVPSLGSSGRTGPIAAILDTFAVPDLLDMRDPATPPKTGLAPPKGQRVPGLACPSDSLAMGGPGVSTLSYRANTGDEPSGATGPFAPGQTMTSAQVEAADGLSYTAAFGERLVGDGKDGHPAPRNYAITPGTETPPSPSEIPADRWRGDAGTDWSEASWRSTLYNHALTPGFATSTIAQDGRTGWMGVSSSHVGRSNLLMMDGSLRTVTPQIDLKVWKALGTVGTPGPMTPP